MVNQTRNPWKSTQCPQRDFGSRPWHLVSVSQAHFLSVQQTSAIGSLPDVSIEYQHKHISQQHPAPPPLSHPALLPKGQPCSALTGQALMSSPAPPLPSGFLVPIETEKVGQHEIITLKYVVGKNDYRKARSVENCGHPLSSVADVSKE